MHELTGKIRVFLVDDHPIVRLGLAQLINNELDMQVCGEAEDAVGALGAMEYARPDIVLLDISLPGPDGLEVLKAIRYRDPQLSVLILTMHDEFPYAQRALRMGAKGFMLKQEASGQVITAIRQVLAGDIYVSERMAVKIVQSVAETPVTKRPSVESLTTRELEVLVLVGQGHSTREIATSLNLSIKTVESYCAHIKEKLALRNVRELMQYAVHWVDNRSVRNAL